VVEELQQGRRCWHGLRHVESRACERSIRAHARAVADADLSPYSAKLLFDLRPAAWHPSPASGARAPAGEAQHGGIDVDAIHDHSEPGIRRLEGCCDRTGLATAQRTHGVEEMREAPAPSRRAFLVCA
jgi:hypothetical protein